MSRRLVTVEQFPYGETELVRYGKTELWIPGRADRDILRGHPRERLERDYKWAFMQLTGRLPTGDWFDLLIQELERIDFAALVQTGSKMKAAQATGGTATITGVTAGNHLVAMFATRRQATAAGAIPTTGLTGAGWTIAEAPNSVGNANSSSAAVLIAHKEGAAAGSHSAPVSGLPSFSNLEGIIAEFSGIASSSSLDKHNHNASSSFQSSGTTGTTSTLTNATELAVCVGTAWDGNGDISGISTAPSGWTSLANTQTSDENTDVAWFCAYLLTAATTALNPSFSWAGSTAPWAAAISTYLPGGGGGAATSKPFLSQSPRFVKRRRYV